MLIVKYCPRCGNEVAEELKFGKLRPVCPVCGYVHFVNPKVAAVIFIENDGKVLLVERGVDPHRGKWDFPAGYIDYGENPVEAAKRETLEETGLIVEITGLIDISFDETVIAIFYRARIVGGTLLAGDDVQKVDWFSPHNLPELAFKSTQSVINSWSSRLA